MIDTAKLINFFKKKIDYFVGVPDSVLKNFSNHLENSKEKKHIVSTNEGSAVALAIGRYLAKKKISNELFKIILQNYYDGDRDKIISEYGKLEFWNTQDVVRMDNAFIGRKLDENLHLWNMFLSNNELQIVYEAFNYLINLEN